MQTPCSGEEPACCSVIAAEGDEHVDDLAVLINRSVDVAPASGDLHVRLVHIPAVADRVPARSGGILEQWREGLCLPVDGDVVDLDPSLTEQLLDISIREPIPQISPYGEDDDLRREPEPDQG